MKKLSKAQEKMLDCLKAGHKVQYWDACAVVGLTSPYVECTSCKDAVRLYVTTYVALEKRGLVRYRGVDSSHGYLELKEVK